MWELNNDQRRCLGLDQVAAHWRRIPVKASPYDDFETVAYLEDDVVRKCINSGGDCYIEYQLNERVTPDGRYLLPRTERGKPVLLSSANLKKRTSVGMCLLFSQRGAIDLYSSERQCAYFNNRYLPPLADRHGTIEQFAQWVEQWCADTAPEDDYLIHFDPRDKKLARALLDSHKLVGWALIAFGALIAYQSLLMNTLGDLVYRWGHFSPAFRALYLVMASLPDVVVCVALIVCGIWLVKGPRTAKKPDASKDVPEDADFCEYHADEADHPEKAPLRSFPVVNENEVTDDGTEHDE